MRHWNKHGYVATKRRKNWERKLLLIERLGGKCRACGNADIRVLDINHLDRHSKKRPKDGNYNWVRRLKDWTKNVARLELLCANCHRVHTWDQLGWGKGLEEARAILAESKDSKPHR